MFDLSNRVALVTGATGRLGNSMAIALAEAGASLVVTSREQTRAQALAEQLPPSRTAKHHGVGLDHLDEKSLRNGFEQLLHLAGSVDILINNGHESLAADWTGVTAEQFDRQMRVATGYFLLARLVRDHAVDRKAPASIIMMGSMYGLVGSYPKAYESVGSASPVAYHALKGGIIQMTRHLAVYWAKDRIRVNTISPGPFAAPTVPAQLVANLCEHTPLGRIGQPEELKGAAVFLASDASSFVTGHNLVVDGGWTAW
jgi:gluconate 5-dehydrogenase